MAVQAPGGGNGEGGIGGTDEVEGESVVGVGGEEVTVKRES